MTIDLAMGLLLETVKSYQRLKVVICSATINEQTFKNFFDQCEVLHINGRMFPVEEIYQPPSVSGGHIKKACNILKQICKEKKEGMPNLHGHMLVFLAGIDEIEQLKTLLNHFLKDEDLSDEIVVLPLHGVLDHEEQQEIF